MGLLQTLERMLGKSPRGETRVELKEIFCKPGGRNFIEKINTAASGCQYSNPDGSSRQKALQKIKSGERVRLVWHDKSSGTRGVVYLLKGGKKTQELFMPDCFGCLNDKISARVVRWLTRDNIVTAAKVVKITGGTRKQPRLGCVLELTTYPGPLEKKAKTENDR